MSARPPPSVDISDPLPMSLVSDGGPALVCRSALLASVTARDGLPVPPLLLT